jgi:hypothetical protein
MKHENFSRNNPYHSPDAVAPGLPAGPEFVLPGAETPDAQAGVPEVELVVVHQTPPAVPKDMVPVLAAVERATRPDRDNNLVHYRKPSLPRRVMKFLGMLITPRT